MVSVTADKIKTIAKTDPQSAYRRAGFSGQLKKQGKNFVGLCPFHQNTKPSFTITLSGDDAQCFHSGNRVLT